MTKQDNLKFTIQRRQESRLDDCKAIIRQAKSLASTLQDIALKISLQADKTDSDKDALILDAASFYQSTIESAARWVEQYHASAKKASEELTLLSHFVE